MAPSAAIHERILDNDIRGAREILWRYIGEHGLAATPAMEIEQGLAVYKTLGESGLGRLVPAAIRAMACRPDADVWHRLHLGLAKNT